ncbi:Crp/Fnr family transcriptional regulator [Sphaerisporangium sp. NPDC051011]|uniref:Crp/Fnr family transcriptional regulator n=1 Tax=Sphaerisporangium sp. NPDC051011 TaxID=3155792 RepID=UPI0033CD0C43
MPSDGAQTRRRRKRPWSAGSMMAGLDEDAQMKLLGLATWRYQPPGDVLIRQGETDPKYVYLLQEPRRGICAKVTVRLDDAHTINGRGGRPEALLGIMVSGDLIGEMAVLRRATRSATVTLCARTLVYRIPSDAFLALLGTLPSLASALAATIADRLEWADRRRLDMIGYDVPFRLARVLVDLADRHGHVVPEGRDVGVSLAQHELGRLVGAGEAAVGKAMREFKDAGLIITRYRRVILTDAERLRGYPGRAS